MEKYKVALLDQKGELVMETTVYARNKQDAERKAVALVEASRDKNVKFYAI